MAIPTEKMVKKRELPKIEIPKPEVPQSVTLKELKPMRMIKREAREAMTRSEKNATRVAESFVEQFSSALNRTQEGKEFLANMKKNSQIGSLLFE